MVSETPVTETARANTIAWLWAEGKRRSRSGRATTAIRGGTWTLIGHVSVSLLRMATTLLLARHFLGPETFGVVGLVGVFLTGLGMFSELGVVTAVVQHRRGDDSEFLNTAFSIQSARGVGIWVTAALAAYPLALFYHQPGLFPLLIAAAFTEAIRGLTSTAAWTLNRHVNLRNLTLLSIGSETIAFGVAILWALISPSAWVLVVRTMAGVIVYAAGSHFISARRVRFQWEPSAAKDLLHFGGWISISTAAHFLGFQGERLFLGKFTTAAELGCFSLALIIASVPGDGIGTLVNQVFLPMLSATVRTDRAATVRDFLRARRVFFLIGSIAAVGFLSCAKPVVALVLPGKYTMVGWMLQVLGLRVALDVFSAPVSSLILAYGRSKYAAIANITRLIAMVAGVSLAFSFFSVRQAVIALIAAQILSYFPLIAGLRKVLPEVAFAEFRWYILFLLMVGCAALVPWPGL